MPTQTPLQVLALLLERHPESAAEINQVVSHLKDNPDLQRFVRRGDEDLIEKRRGLSIRVRKSTPLLLLQQLIQFPGPFSEMRKPENENYSRSALRFLHAAGIATRIDGIWRLTNDKLNDSETFERFEEAWGNLPEEPVPAAVPFGD